MTMSRLTGYTPPAVDRARDAREARDAAHDAHARRTSDDDDANAEFVLPASQPPHDPKPTRTALPEGAAHTQKWAKAGDAASANVDGDAQGDGRLPHLASTAEHLALHTPSPDAGAIAARAPAEAPGGMTFRFSAEALQAGHAHAGAPSGRVAPGTAPAVGAQPVGVQPGGEAVATLSLPTLGAAASSPATVTLAALSAQANLALAAATSAANTPLPPALDPRLLASAGLAKTPAVEVGLEVGLGDGKDGEHDKDDGSEVALAARVGADAGHIQRAEHGHVVPVHAARPIGEQVADAVTKLMTDAAHDGVVRFKGGELGNFTAHIRQEGLGVSVRLVPDDPSTRTSFMARVPEVRDALVRAGVRLDALDVRTSPDGRGERQDPNDRRQRRPADLDHDVFKELL